MRNMRINFGDDRDAVIKELERLGYVESPNNCGPYGPEDAECNIIVTYKYGQWMDFDEYVSANYKRLEGQTRELVEDAFKAGQQSKQAEIDALKAKINRALKALEKLDGYDYNEDLDSVFLILGE